LNAIENIAFISRKLKKLDVCYGKCERERVKVQLIIATKFKKDK
jgi:hypothetical protein